MFEELQNKKLDVILKNDSRIETYCEDTMMRFFYEQARATGMNHMAYAHLGRGHPHTNLIAKNEGELSRVHDVLITYCRKAVALGGGAAAEHGIGKMHKDLLSIQHDEETLKRMWEIKQERDPKNILGRGTIF